MVVEELLECLTLGTNFLVVPSQRIIKHFSANFVKLARPTVQLYLPLFWGFLFLDTFSIIAGERLDRLEPSKLLLLLILCPYIIRLLIAVEI